MIKTTCRFLVSLAILSALTFAGGGCRPGQGGHGGPPLQSMPEGTPDAHGRPLWADEMPVLAPVALGQGEKLKVVASTSIVADVVQQVGGERIALIALMPLGADPHAFEPAPRDAAAVADAHVVFVNGMGLEVFLEKLFQSAGEGVTVVPVSYGIEPLRFEEEGVHGEAEGDHHGEAEGDHHGEAEGDHHGEDEGDHYGEADPHTWFDPHNVIVWTRNIAHALGALDPPNAQAYQASAAAYEAELRELDAWIREQIARLPEGKRRLVTDHASFGYFARRYGFAQVGTLFPGYSTLAEPSAQDLAALEDAIRALDVPAVFVGLTVNPGLAERVAEDTGTRLVFLYTGSLSAPGGPADDYISFMRYNVSAIVEALR